jgi:hypothetical protein
MTGRWLTVAMVGLLVGMMLVGCGSKVSKSNYDKIENGMTMEEVEGILGSGEEASAGVSVGGLDVTGAVY